MQQRQYPTVHLHVGAKRLTAGSGGTHAHICPATGAVTGEIPLAGTAEVEAAVEAAHAAYDSWRRWRPAERRDVLLKLATLLGEKAEKLGEYTTMDNGIPVSVTSQHGPIAKSWIAYYAGLSDKIEGQVTASPIDGGDFGYTAMDPYGVVGLIVTWNGPVANLCMKAGAALAAGNTIVVKSPEVTPYSLEIFMECVREAGIPAGVVNLFPGGPEAGAALVAHPKVKKISFTGGPAGARKVLAACAEQIKPAVVELGGKSANIIFADADLDFAAQHAALFSAAIISGQGCAFPTRCLVEESVYEDVIQRIVAILGAIKIGDPWDPTTVMGPVLTEASMNRILDIVAKADADGDGKLILGGKRVGGEHANGFYIEPTVFRDVDNASPLAQEEIFGPVLAIMKFSDEDEAIRLANDTRYGLAAYIQSNNLRRVHRVAAQLAAGGIYVNGGSFIDPASPFGGLGLSGFGREGGRYGLEEFLQPKAIRIGTGQIVFG